MKIEKVNNEDIPTSMNMPKDTSLSEASKHIRKEIDDWIRQWKSYHIARNNKSFGEVNEKFYYYYSTYY